MDNRMTKAKQLLQESEIDAILLTNLNNIRYVSNFVGTLAYCLITKEKGYLLVDGRYAEQAVKQCPDFEIVEFNRKIGAYYELLYKICSEENIKILGFEEKNVVFSMYKTIKSQFKKIELKPIDTFIEKLRYVKDTEEIEKIRRAASITDKAFSHVLKVIRPGITEKEIQKELEIGLLLNGASGPSFETIIVSGNRTSMQHGKATDKIVKKGEFVLMDFGALYEGYRSDMTRTVVVGQPDEKQKEIYSLVYNSMYNILENIKSGMKISEIYNIAAKNCRDSKYFEYFAGGLGHGIGLDIHEEPFMKLDCDMELKEGMVLAIEPRIHIAGWGGVRIENDVLIIKDGCEILSKSESCLVIL